MRQSAAGRLVQTSAAHHPKRWASIGGRASPLGFSTPPDKHPRIKQAGTGVIAQHVPGTTRLRYTNQKGRTFTFSIPVGQLTHPPVVRRGAAAEGWHEIDTSFSDVGSLEEDMPTEVGERLAAASVAGDAGLVEMNQEELQALQRAFVQLCRDYVLMDTSGMKTSMMHSELNNGPDYELYDRKLRRRRHWLAIRHRYEDVRELLWPSDAAAATAAVGGAPSSSADAESEHAQADGPLPLPLLSVTDMMEALTWLEAASTFAIRKHRPFDTAAVADFAPLDLSREVRIVAACVSSAGPTGLFFHAEAGGGDEQRQAATDRVIALGALCANHHVPLSAAFTPRSALSSSPSGQPATAPAAAGVHGWLSCVPPLTRVKDAVRVMAVMHTHTQGSLAGAAGGAVRFSDADGVVVDTALLDALCRLASASLFSDASALENVDAGELCTLLRFATELQEQNGAFLRPPSRDEGDSGDVSGRRAVAVQRRSVLQHFTRLVLARCRRLLASHAGEPLTLLSGDAENIPIVELQAFADHNHPSVRVHEKIGRENAQGLRHARLQPSAATALAELLRRMESANTRWTTSAHRLGNDLLRHVAQKAVLGKSKLTLEDVTRALPLLAAAMRTTSEAQVKTTYARLFTAMSTTIGAALQQPQRPESILGLLEGLADCHYAPSSYKLLEMVMLRLMMRGDFSLEETGRCLTAMLAVVGPRGVSPSVQQAIAMRVVTAVEASPEAEVGPAVLTVLRALRFSSYPSFASLMCLVARSPVLGRSTAVWTPSEHTRFGVLLAAAAAALAETDVEPEMVATLSASAREQLLLGFSASVPLAFPGEDAAQECLTACAALQLTPTPAALSAWAHADRGARAVHSLCTPQLAVSTMEALEATGLAGSRWYDEYAAYVATALRQMQRGGGEAGALLEDDAETAARCLYLRHVADEVRALAAALMENEVRRLDSVLVSAPPSSSPVCTFQQRALERQAHEAAAEARLVRYCAALHHASTADVAAAA
ncbi:hypothetical protein NESM_000152100 [Novymonas esmeraldas]|uniref:Uncharacterized protein n=1 Tax=Novymonas esmeraldas TaxID=1808958 RepID=A0AAW0F5A1_9TRYP